ncbi:MAG: DUF1015 domain-containing protein [Burkholderiales bacterium]|nr:DUF1015 domain-containing protein [Burkholderiales bacterium]
MQLIHPFAGLRPAPEHAAEVAAPPYDVLSSAEARERAAGKRWSFLHISKPEIDLPADTDPFAPQVYAKAAENLRGMIAHGVLRRDARPCFYVYRLRTASHTQIGLALTAAVADYDSNRIRRHEYTRPDKEDDRVRQIEALDAQTGPVLLAYPDAPEVDDILGRWTQRPPATDVEADGGVRHAIWVVDDAPAIATLTRAFDAMPVLYIADGHHRSAAASRVAAARRGQASAQRFLAVAFAHHQMRILDYNRLVRDLHGMTAAQFLARIGQAFSVEQAGGAVRPAGPGEFGLYLAGAWHRLRIRADLARSDDPVRCLDVSLLADHLLEPVLGIVDPRTDRRIDFVGGGRGLGELERRVDSGEMAAAFSLHPTRMRDLMAVADAGRVMPPKSTWFEPKLADGLVSHVLD